jgi:hypothetical protein
VLTHRCAIDGILIVKKVANESSIIVCQRRIREMDKVVKMSQETVISLSSTKVYQSMLLNVGCEVELFSFLGRKAGVRNVSKEG